MTAPLSGKILVADDNDAFRSMLAEYMARHGCEVLQATNGLEALLHVKHESPRVIIIDVTMPRLEGFEAVKRIRHFTPAVRIVIVTGNTDDPDVARQAHRYDAVLLIKPLDLPLDTWRGIGDVVVGMTRQDYDVELTRYDGRGWRATFYTTGRARVDFGRPQVP